MIDEATSGIVNKPQNPTASQDIAERMAVSRQEIGDAIDNAGSDRDGDLQRSGGSPNDPDGGHELLGREWHGPDPDQIEKPMQSGPRQSVTKEAVPVDSSEEEGAELVKHEGFIRPEPDTPL